MTPFRNHGLANYKKKYISTVIFLMSYPLIIHWYSDNDKLFTYIVCNPLISYARIIQ